ncbi:hypothetical protein GLYMA_13G336900v4 [Glycine max]|uniref:oxysterol-binding protein-related protein 3C isoform X1 n=1 Tax=Glycine max TaxID=3847 RepID=UPI000719439C|nr:oxysterol-binding protein-related protein 3C isoform X1 [Glycine max]KAG4384729.1 hypothetical protein GLYMA_13G336900v4 [Glycine max]KAH1104711.1 hypothetical protein GYH30_038196 [Glycine max]|eukprot:XP_014621569.1 oxysterol-binding protein-related protein 3C isoform X1 [Glycine max]
MGSPEKNENKGFFATMTSGFSMFSSAMHRSVNGMLGHEGVEVINPEGSKEDAEEETQRGRWKPELLQRHGLYLCTLHINEPGSLLTLSLERLMRWLTMVELHFLQNRYIS